ncbi:hypothetical protein VTJ04DRAFT_10033 [Mycothermus thermophilus]|uniref:uncharacterized protein n=1 Tax=Humicola insolens TaxID=85995 RepID=UPI0037443396
MQTYGPLYGYTTTGLRATDTPAQWTPIQGTPQPGGGGGGGLSTQGTTPARGDDDATPRPARTQSSQSASAFICGSDSYVAWRKSGSVIEPRPSRIDGSNTRVAGRNTD